MAKIFDTYKSERDKEKLNLQEFLVSRPASTFFLRLDTNGPKGSSVLAGDVLVVDRAQQPKNNDLMIVCKDGEMIICYFQAENQSEESQLWGVVVGVVRKF